MAFENRAEAGKLLAAQLNRYREQHPLVLAIPHGAVPMGKILANALEGDLDVVLFRKLRAPYNPELAIGSIDETGAVYLDPVCAICGTSHISGQKRRLNWLSCGSGDSSMSLLGQRSTQPPASPWCSTMALPPVQR
jgi:putative phosphoribosyl transferase